MADKLRSISEHLDGKNGQTFGLLREKASGLPSFFGNKPSLFQRSEALIGRLPEEIDPRLETASVAEIKTLVQQDVTFIEQGLAADNKYDSAELRQVLREIQRLTAELV